MGKTYAGGAYQKTNVRQQQALAKLDKTEQRLRLFLDTQRWISSGHRIERLPPGPATDTGRFVCFSSLMIETGYAYEL